MATIRLPLVKRCTSTLWNIPGHYRGTFRNAPGQCKGLRRNSSFMHCAKCQRLRLPRDDLMIPKHCALTKITRPYSSDFKKAQFEDIRRVIEEQAKHKKSNPVEVYKELLQKELVDPDEKQKIVIDMIQKVYDNLENYSPNAKSSGFFSKFLSPAEEVPKGLYLHGDVGTGKTLLMDLFYHCCKFDKKRRVHFHAFMLDVHARIHRLKQAIPRDPGTKAKPYDPISPVAKEISEETWLLCFDEFQVTDIADAMILKRLFTELFKNGVVMVATSNRSPDDLYKGGLQRSNFLPFIDVLKHHCHSHDIGSDIDYRQRGPPLDGKVYFLSSDPGTEYNLDEIFKYHTHLHGSTSETGSTILRVLGRDLLVPKCKGYVADFTFEEICMRPLGAVDYIELTKHFFVIIIRDVPLLNIFRKQEASRLIKLIDTFYDAKIGLIMSGAVLDPIDLFVQATNEEKAQVMLQNTIILDDLSIKQDEKSVDLNIFSGEEEQFAFRRAVSRLKEMQTKSYWAEHDAIKIKKLKKV